MNEEVDFSKIRRAFEKAGGLIEGLNTLRDTFGSKIEFNLDDVFGNTVLINTNISTPKSVEMTIFVDADGDVKGDDGRFYTTKEALEYAKTRAAEQGLIP